MARIVAQSIFKPASPEWGNAVLFRMQDGTMWIYTFAAPNAPGSPPNSPGWAQAPALPGSRIVSNIDYNLGIAYACATDGTIFSGIVQAGFAWQIIANTPP